MLDFPALPINKTLSMSSRADEDDVVLTKHVLSQVGHFDAGKHGLTPFPDAPLFDGIRAFQKANKLHVDGVMRPAGETASTLGDAFARQLYLDVAGRAKSPNHEAKEHCENLFWNIDMPACRTLKRRRGKVGALAFALCTASAMKRYSDCLAGKPMNQLSPLYTWSN